MKKRILPLLLALCLLAALIPLPVRAADSGTCGEGLTWTLDDSGALYISGSGAMADYAQTEDEPWFSHLLEIRSVTLGVGVTHIGAFAFFSCANLTSVDIPATVKDVGYYAFGFCDKLSRVTYARTAARWREVEIAAGNTTLVGATIEYGMDVRLTTQSLSVDGQPRSAEVYNINGSNYFKLRDLAALLNGTGSRFAVDYDAQARAISVTTSRGYISVGGELESGADKSDTCQESSQALLIDGKRAHLTAYNIGGNNFYGLRELGRELGYAVDYDAATRTILLNSVPGPKLSSGSCGDGLTWTLYADGLLSISGLGALQADGVFKQASFDGWRDRVREVSIGDGVTGLGRSNQHPLDGLSSVTLVRLGKALGELSSDAFWGLPALEAIEVAPDNRNYRSVNGVVFDRAGETLLRYPAGKQDNSYTVPAGVKRIGDYAFSRCAALNLVDFPDSVTEIGSNAFSASAITALTLPAGLKTLGWSVFSDCAGLHSLTVPGTLAAISSQAFYGCTGLEYVELREGVTEISTFVFEGCTGLTTLRLPRSIRKIDYHAFADCGALTDVYYAGSQREWDSVSVDLTGSNLIFALLHCEG